MSLRLHLAVCGQIAAALFACACIWATGSAQALGQRPASHGIADSGYVAHPGALGQDVYWLDNDRVLFIGTSPAAFIPPNPAALPNPSFDLYVWNLNAKSVKRHREGSPYSSLCVSKGHVRFEFDERGSRFVFEGPFGSERLSPLDPQVAEERRRNERAVNPYTCREYKWSELPRKGSRVIPLLEDEYLSQDREPRIGEVIHWRFWPRKRPSVILDMGPEPIGVDRYSEYLDAYVLNEAPFNYVFSDSVVRRAWLMDRNGGYRDFTPPTGPWMRGSTYVAPTRRGLFLISHAVRAGGNGDAGGYLLDGGKLKRVIEGLPTSFAVSPDGCRVALPISQVSRDKPNLPFVKIVDLCSKGS